MCLIAVSSEIPQHPSVSPLEEKLSEEYEEISVVQSPEDSTEAAENASRKTSASWKRYVRKFESEEEKKFEEERESEDQEKFFQELEKESGTKSQNEVIPDVNGQVNCFGCFLQRMPVLHRKAHLFECSF